MSCEHRWGEVCSRSEASLGIRYGDKIKAHMDLKPEKTVAGSLERKTPPLIQVCSMRLEGRLALKPGASKILSALSSSESADHWLVLQVLPYFYS